MRLHILSDLHLDHAHSSAPPGELPVFTKEPWRIPRTDADVVIVAGDWCHGWDRRVGQAVDGVAVPLITVLGNHDWYDRDIPREGPNWTKNIRRKHPNVRVLNPGVVDLGRVRFVGCTWWAGLTWSENSKLTGKPLSQADLMAGVQRAINDFNWISHSPGYFTAAYMLEIHQRETTFLEKEIARAKRDGMTLVVVTHFSPSRRGIHATFAGSLANPYFHNDREDLTEGVTLWIHGHTHLSCDYIVPSTGCRVVCNTRGYPSDRMTSGFQPDLVVEVATP